MTSGSDAPGDIIESAGQWLARRLRLLRRDAGALALAIGLPWIIVLAVQLPLAVRDGVADRRTVFYLYLVFAFWIGLNATAREVVGRRAVWRRELRDGVRRGALALGAVAYAALVAAWSAGAFAGGLAVELVHWPALEERLLRDDGDAPAAGTVADRLAAAATESYGALPLAERRALADALGVDKDRNDDGAAVSSLPGVELTRRLREHEAAAVRQWAERFAPGALRALATARDHHDGGAADGDGCVDDHDSGTAAGSGLDELLPSTPADSSGKAALAAWRREAVAAWCLGERAPLATSLSDALGRAIDELGAKDRERIRRRSWWLVPAGLLTAAPGLWPSAAQLARAWTVLFMTAWTGALLGLWLSTRARTAESAAQWVPLLTIPQILFNPVLLRNLSERAGNGFGVLGLGSPGDAAWWREQTAAGLAALAVPCRYAYRWLNDFVDGGGGLLWAEIGGRTVPAWEGLALLAWSALFAFLFSRGLTRLRDREN